MSRSKDYHDSMEELHQRYAQTIINQALELNLDTVRISELIEDHHIGSICSYIEDKDQCLNAKLNGGEICRYGKNGCFWHDVDNTYASNFNNSRKTKNHSARAGQHKVNGDKVNGDKVNVDKHNEDKHNEVINNHNLIIDKFNESNGTLGIMSSNKNLQFIKEPIDIETYLTEAEYGPVLITEGHWVYESKDYYFILKDTSLGGGYLIDTQGCEFVGVLKNEYNKIFREDKNYNEVGWEKLLEEVEAKSSQYLWTFTFP